MGTRNIAIAAFASVLLCTTATESDVRNLNWNEILDARYTICMGRLTSLREERETEYQPAVVARVELTRTVTGECPESFEIRSSDVWEVMERPDRLGADYLIFLTLPITPLEGVPVYRISHRHAWERRLGRDCWGKSYFYYNPAYVNFPGSLRTIQCVRQALPLGGALDHNESVLLEERLLSELKNPTVRQ